MTCVSFGAAAPERRFNLALSGTAHAGAPPITLPDHARAMLHDLSEAGAGVGCDWMLAPGVGVELDLPGAGGPVKGRMARSSGSEIGLVFDADPANLARIGLALNALAPVGKAA